MRILIEEHFVHRYFVLSRHDIGYLRFLLEGYDGLAFARTLEKQTGLVEIAYSQSVSSVVENLLVALADEINLCEVPEPPQVPPL